MALQNYLNERNRWQFESSIHDCGVSNYLHFASLSVFGGAPAIATEHHESARIHQVIGDLSGLPLINTADRQNHSLTIKKPASKTATDTGRKYTSASQYGTVFHGSKKKRVGTGSARTAFSTGVVLNHKTLPTKVTFDGESQLCFSLKAKPSSVKLTDKFTVSGVKISGTVGSSGSISGSGSKKTVTISHSKKKPKKKTCINNVNSGISFKGAIVHVKQQVTGVVMYKNTKYTMAIGDE